MTLKQALAILAANDVAAKGTFMFAFHERWRFDKALFWKFYDALTVIAAAPPEKRGPDAGPQTLHVYQYILSSIIFHFDSGDSFKLRGLPRRDLSAYLNRLEWVCTPIINRQRGRGPDQSDDGLKRPAASKPKRRVLRRRAMPRRSK